MRNLVNTEKSLKHWFKNKVTITTATVVGFLIMGTVSFGAETHHVTKTETLSSSIEVIKDEDTAGVSIDTENITLTNGTAVTATSNNNKAFGIKSDVKADVINNGTITATALNKDNTSGTETATKDIAAGIALNKGGKAENNGNINAEGYRATGIEAKEGATVVNNKNAKIVIKSKGKIENSQGRTAAAYGINLNDSIGVNHGTIETTSGELSRGVNINISKNFTPSGNVFENHGTIVAALEEKGGGSSNAIFVNSNTDKEITIVNKKGAALETNDNLNNKNSATVRIEKGNVSFVNDGKISTKNNGTGIYVIDKKSNIINNGEIEVTGKTGIGVFSVAKFTNNKTINVNTTDNAIGVQSNNEVINGKDGNITVNSKSGIGILLKRKGNATNEGNINVTGIDKAYGVELSVNKGEVSTATFSNIGNITVKNNTDNKIAYGVYLENGASAVNSGKIDAISQGRAAGVNIYLDDEYKGTVENPLFVNESTGEITASSKYGGTANAVSVTNKSTQKVTIENNGTLISDGKNGTNNGKPFYNPVVNLAGKNIEFTNNGTIVAGDGVGIYLNGDVGITDKPIDNKMIATNNGTIKVNSTGKAVINYGTAVNNGVIQITDKTAEELKNEKFNADTLFTGSVTNSGLFADANGMDIDSGDSLAKIEIYTSELTGESIKIGKGDKSILIGDESPASVKTLNVVGKVQAGNKTEADEVYLEAEHLNFDANGQFNVGEDDILVLGSQDKNIAVNTIETQSKTDRNVITLENGAELGLENATLNQGVNVFGEGTVSATGETIINSNITSKNFEIFDGNILFNGVLSSDTVIVDKGALNKDTRLTLSSGASFGKTATLNTVNGTTVFEIGAKGENALANSQNKVTVNGNIDFDTKNLTTNTTVKLNNEKDKITHDLTNAEYQEKTDGIYNTHLDKNKNTLEFAYNKSLYNNSELNALNNIMQGKNNKLSQNLIERANQLDEIYAGNIYSETVRAGYDNIKLNEETVLSLGKTAKGGELKTHGKALYTKDEYTRKGVLNNFDAEVETTGLFAGAEYGLSDTMSVGAVFSGAKQDVAVSNESADGDLFYLGVYGTKVLGNYNFTAGLGYQLGKYDADYNMAEGLTASEKYDSNAVNGYVQGRYTANLGEGLSIQPKVKLGYTYIEQDVVNDNNYKVSDAEVSTFDAEAGVDVVKSVQFEKSKLDVKFGTSYIKAMGDIDKKFTLSTKNGSAEILGAELTENTLKFGLDAEVENVNGFFYNAGVNYRFGSGDTEAYSVNAGAGYKF